MKIAILTQPLFFNYGGILQAYALQTILARLGHESIILDRKPVSLSHKFPYSFILDIKYYIRKILRKPCQARNSRQNKLISSNTRLFTERYLVLSPSLYNTKQLKKYIRKYNPDCYIVGSDQVWRPCNSPNIYNYFLDFCSDKSVKKIAYAASFGVDDWEYSNEETIRCKTLIKSFDRVSVREESGIFLCQKYLETEAIHVLDPTMLLNKKDYELIAKNESYDISGSLFCYVLDRSAQKQLMIDFMAQETGLIPFECMPKYPDTPRNIEKYRRECIYPPVQQWIQSFMRAEIVLTDSFHGTVFSIIFNKPFWVIGNKKRGLSRFKSLLKMFDLENRILDSSANNIDFWEPINWELVNTIRNDQKNKCIAFIVDSLRQKNNE